MTSRLPIAIWHLLIAALAWWGLALSMNRFPADLLFFSNIVMLGTAVVFTALVVAGARGGAGHAGVVARGACAMYGVIVAVVFNALLDGDLSELPSLLGHAVVPALLLADWLFVRRRGVPLGGGVVALWMVIPLLYVPLYTLNDRPGAPGAPIYGFLDPEEPDYWPLVCAFVGFFLLVGLLVWALRTGRPWRDDPAAGVPGAAAPANPGSDPEPATPARAGFVGESGEASPLSTTNSASE